MINNIQLLLPYNITFFISSVTDYKILYSGKTFIGLSPLNMYVFCTTPCSQRQRIVKAEGYLLSAAIDFGTTFSGYAFSFKNSQLKIRTNAGWNAGSEKLMSLKTPTCVLVNPSKEFDSFGFEAENKYVALADESNHHNWLLFRCFKMILHRDEVAHKYLT